MKGVLPPTIGKSVYLAIIPWDPSHVGGSKSRLSNEYVIKNTMASLVVVPVVPRNHSNYIGTR